MYQFSVLRREVFRAALASFRYYSSKMSKNALVLISGGTEEMEFVISVDVLRRAGINVTVAGVRGDQILECSRKVRIAPDTSLDDAVANSQYDVVVLPGGLKGSAEFCRNQAVGDLLREQEKSGRLIAAICAAPTALKAHQVCLGKKLTSYPTVQEELLDGDNYTYMCNNVVVDGNLITSRGPGTAFNFALAIVEVLLGKNAVLTLEKELLLS